MQQLPDSYQQFHSGLSFYTNGVSKLYRGSTQYQDGLEAYLDGVGQASDETNEFADGMQSYADGISGIPDEMQTQIDEMMEQYGSSDFDAVSFADSRNTNINSVQFILTTDGVEALHVCLSFLCRNRCFLLAKHLEY